MRTPSTVPLALVILCGTGVGQEMGATVPADDLTPSRRMVLGADLAAEFQWTLVGLDMNAPARRPKHPSLNTFHRLWHCPIARGRHIFKAEFTRPFVTENTVYHLYLDADDDRDTGRKDKGHRGVDGMFTVSGGYASLSRHNASGASVRGSAARRIIEGNVVYLSADVPIKQEGGKSVFEYHITFYVKSAKGQRNVSAAFPRTKVSSRGEPDLEAEALPHVALIDTTDFKIESVAAEVLYPESVDKKLRARVTWRTNWIAPNTVEYGLTPEYGAKVTAGISSRNHRVVIDGLEPAKTYHYRLVAMTPTGELFSSPDHTFETRGPSDAKPSVARGRTPLRVINREPRAIRDWPVRAGMPFARGEIVSTQNLRLLTPDGGEAVCAWSVMSRWPDGSLRWAQADFRASARAASAVEYQVEYGSQVQAAKTDSPLRVTESAEGITVDTGRLRFTIRRNPFEPFTEVALRAADGTLRRLDAGGLLIRVQDVDGKTYHSGRGLRVLTVEQANREVVGIKAVGDHVAEDGAKFLEWTLRIYAYAGCDFVRVFHTFGINDVEREFTEFRRLALCMRTTGAAGTNCHMGGDKPVALKIPNAGRLRLFQPLDDSCRIEIPGAPPRDGKRAAGWVSVGQGHNAVTVALRDFWQHYPKSLLVGPGAVEIGIAPSLAPDQYDAFKDREHMLFAPYRLGVYRFIKGFEKRHELLVQFGERNPDAVALFQNPPVACVTPRRYRDTNGLGRIAVADELPPRFGGYTEAVRNALRGYLNRRDANHEYGLMHFGDWFGERKYNWGNMEYDTPHGLLLQFASCGDPAFFAEGVNAARHYMDVDVVHHAKDPRHVGLVWVHAMLHTGGYYKRDDPRFGIAYKTGHAQNWGHMWGEGLMDYYWLTGDPRAREVLLDIADMTASYFVDNRAHRKSIARHPGWMSMILLAGYRITGDEYYLNAVRTIMDYMIEWQKPCGGWTRRLGGGHCQCDPPHHGNAGFMVAVLMSGMKRYHEITGDERVAKTLVRAARWMIEDLWVERDKAYRYTSCPRRTRGGGSFHMNESVAYAYRLTGAALFRDAALQSPSTRLTRVSSGGKGISAHIRAVPHTLPDLIDMSEGRFYHLTGPGPHTMLLRETTDRQFRIRVRASGQGRISGKLTITAPGGNAVMVGTLTGEGQIDRAFDVPADEVSGTHRLVIAPDVDAQWEVQTDLYREVVELSDDTELGGGVRHPRYRFYVASKTGTFAVLVRSRQRGDRRVAVLDPNGVEHAARSWSEAGKGEWQRIEITVPKFEPIAVGFSCRGPLNESDRQWSVMLDGAAMAIRLQGCSGYVSASPLSYFEPGRPTASISGKTKLKVGETPVVSLDGSHSQGLGGRIVSYEWNLGDGTKASGPKVEHTYRRAGRFEVSLTVVDDRGLADTQSIPVLVPPPELAGVKADQLILINGPDFVAQEGGEVLVTNRIGGHGKIITAWEGRPGHKLTWEAPVAKAGRYRICLKFACARQGTTRQFWVDGQQPFAEMASIAFPYTGGWSKSEDNWQYQILRDTQGAPLLFDLSAGKHTISAADRTGGLAVDYLQLIAE